MSGDAMNVQLLIGEQWDKVRQLRSKWDVFCGRLFYFMRSLQEGGASYSSSSALICNYPTFDHVLHYYNTRLTPSSAQSSVVGDWIKLRSDTVGLVMDIRNSTPSAMRKDLSTKIDKLEKICQNNANLVPLAKKCQYPLTEAERTMFGGLINFVPEVLEYLSELLYEMQIKGRSDTELPRFNSHSLPEVNNFSEDSRSCYNDSCCSETLQPLLQENRDRKKLYWDNQSFQRGNPYNQWKLDYLRL